MYYFAFLLLTLTARLISGEILKEEKEFIQEKPIVVVIPSYNNERWVSQNLKSILSQQYSNYRIIYINDHSTDHTLSRVFQVLAKEKKPIDIRVINNKERKGALANLYHAIHTCMDDEIIVTVDGDDWLADPQVFTRLNAVYSSEKPIWLTYGSFKLFPSNTVPPLYPIPEEIIETNSFREFGFIQTHLRTFYAWLFKKICKEDLLYHGEFFPMTWDQAMMFPMIEMAGERHAFLEEISYVYNRLNPINDDKVNQKLQSDLSSYILKQEPYHRLPDENFDEDFDYYYYAEFED
jgi:glycosyltransferase involved in cell wall biosynthesis